MDLDGNHQRHGDAAPSSLARQLYKCPTHRCPRFLKACGFHMPLRRSICRRIRFSRHHGLGVILLIDTVVIRFRFWAEHTTTAQCSTCTMGTKDAHHGVGQANDPLRVAMAYRSTRTASHWTVSICRWLRSNDLLHMVEFKRPLLTWQAWEKTVLPGYCCLGGTALALKSCGS